MLISSKYMPSVSAVCYTFKVLTHSQGHPYPETSIPLLKKSSRLPLTLTDLKTIPIHTRLVQSSWRWYASPEPLLQDSRAGNRWLPFILQSSAAFKSQTGEVIYFPTGQKGHSRTNIETKRRWRQKSMYEGRYCSQARLLSSYIQVSYSCNSVISRKFFNSLEDNIPNDIIQRHILQELRP